MGAKKGPPTLWTKRLSAPGRQGIAGIVDSFRALEAEAAEDQVAVDEQAGAALARQAATLYPTAVASSALAVKAAPRPSASVPVPEISPPANTRVARSSSHPRA
jgi:hypothetical protein